MSFKKGYRQSEDTKRKRSLAQKGRPLTAEHRAKLKGKRPNVIPWNKGKKGYRVHSDEFKEKMRKHIPWNKNKKGIQIAWNKGLKGYNAGEKSSAWKGGITPMNIRLRHSLEYRIWRESVFARDNYMCIWCGDDRGGNLNAHHIKPFADYPELRFAIDNGRTPCRECHKKAHNHAKR